MAYTLPPEWYPQDAILLTWPPLESDWSSMLERIEATFEALVRAISAYQRVVLVLDSHARADAVRTRLTALGARIENCLFHVAPADDTWARDHGPITRLNEGAPELLDYRFTGWGGKFSAERDNALTRALEHCWSVPVIDHQARILEGGAIESNGQGVVLATTACLLNENRGSVSRADWEAHMRTQWGVEHVLWLEHGHLEGDDTDSHIDTLARFCAEDVIAYVHCDDPSDPHFDALALMEAELKAFRTPEGHPYTLVPLPWPRAAFDPEDGHRLPATYANFLITNQEVLVPIYQDPADLMALNVLQSLFPERRVVPVDCTSVIRQHGSLHCLTMQLPKGTLGPLDHH
ncbi:agmatine deiminase family protein [Larsenimonas salina]|uniref:agmatine deiminase family protein n=1 Tax=Larsenimonas salina TaxID=1295565 RepID=UPI002072C522|nr:agmatine deiminase family protein [Larsenimonas salina]MCM5703207.1 agmatine deiminase family protein [Larsenimonas salina]